MPNPVALFASENVFSAAQSTLASDGERRIFRQLRSAAIRMFLLAAEKQQAETVARPAVVIEPAIQAGFFRARLLVNGLSAMRLASFQILELRVVGLWAARERIHQRRVRLAAIECGDCATIGGTEDGSVAIGGEINLVAAIGVEIQRGDVLIMAGGIRKRIGNRFGLNQRAPQFRAQVR